MATAIQTDRLTRALLACGAIAGPLFVIVFLLEGATRAEYDPLRHPISSLAMGDLGWTQRANFIVTGLLTLNFGFGLRRALRVRGGSRWGPLLIGAIAIGLLGAGMFVTDPLNGYPPGTPNLPLVKSTAGVLHDLFSTPVFLGFPAACIVIGRRFLVWGEPGWAWCSIVTGVAFFGAFVLTSIGFRQLAGGALADVAGLLQRVTLVLGFTWLTLFAVFLGGRAGKSRRLAGGG
jgi:hypothetical protein